MRRPHAFFAFAASSCKYLKVDVHNRKKYTVGLYSGWGGQQLNTMHRSQALKLSDNSDISGKCDGDEEQNNASDYPNFPSLRTAIASFCAGSIATIIFSMILFNQSLLNDDPAPFYQNGGVARSSTLSRADKSIPIDTKRAAVIYQSIMEELAERYVDEFDPMRLFETTTRSMLSTLDPYTEYLSAQNIINRQKLVGIGAFVMKAGEAPDLLDGKPVSAILSSVPSAITLPNQLLPSKDAQDDGFRVILSLPGYAYDAGLRVGDEILQIDDQAVTGDTTLERVRELLIGAPGSKVKLAFRRPGNKIQTIDVERKIVQFPNVPYAGTLSQVGLTDGHDDVGYIRLRRFGLDAGISTKQAIQSIQSERMKGLILDLRDNSGGELLSAVQIASLFFPEGTFLGSSAGKGSIYPNESYYAGRLDLRQYGFVSNGNRSGISSSADDTKNVSKQWKQIIDPSKTKIIILVNHRTASASEFLAGAFQDLDKAVVIGSDESSMGKGIGQREIGLPNGGGALKLTYHEFYTPSGRCVQRRYQGRTDNLLSETKTDQLKETFYTANGRVVSNRRGIEVDYKSEPGRSLLSSLLSSSGAYFQFATEFCSRHGGPSDEGGSADFFVDDSLYNDFKAFVRKEQRNGNLKLAEAFDDQHLLDKIQTLAIQSNLHDANNIKSSVARLKEKLVGDLLDEFDREEDKIRKELEMNILARQLSESELTKQSLESDKLVREAKLILEDTTRYWELLGKQSA